MPPKRDPSLQYSLSPAQIKNVEDILPSVRALADEFVNPIKEMVKMVKDKPAVVPWVDEVCSELGIPVRRTYVARLEWVMAAFIQSNDQPKAVLHRVTCKVEVDEAFAAKFLAVAEIMVQLRQVWQGHESEESSDSDDDSSDSPSDEDEDEDEEPEGGEDEPQPAGPAPLSKIKCICGQVFTKAQAKGQYCFKCGNKVPNVEAIQKASAAYERSQHSNVQPGKAKKCNCGANFTKDEAYCPACGKHREDAAPLFINCAQCAQKMPSGQPFCSVCGTSNPRALKRPPKHSKVPSYIYNEVSGLLVDTRAPMKRPSGSVPKEWTPHPALSYFNMPRDAAIGDKAHVKVLKQLQGYLYQGAYERCELTIPTVDHPTGWEELSPLQKALALVEGELHCHTKVATMKMSWPQAKRSSGYTEEVYSLEQSQRMCSQVVMEDKMHKKLEKHTHAASPGGGGKKWQKEYEKDKKKVDKPWQRGKESYGQAGKEHAKEETTTMSSEALQALNRRTQQLEAALNKGGHVKVDGKGKL